MLDVILIAISLATGAGSHAQTEGAALSEETLVLDGVAVADAPASGEEAPPGYEAPVVAAPQPLPYTAEQQVATGKFTTALEIKPIMEATRGNWIAVREYDGQDLVYVTHIWSWRCGLVGLHYGVNGAPLEPWPLPKCHEDTNSPNAMLDGDGLPFRSYPLGHIETVTVELIYDDLSTQKVTYNRQGAMIP